jgi:hypothetical protein
MTQLAQKWKDEFIATDPAGAPVINVHARLFRTTLDVIGEGS